MNDSVDAGVESTDRTGSRARARALGALSLAFGAASFPWFAVLRQPLPSTFPWLTFGLALAAAVTAIMALRARPRGRLAVGLAGAGLVLSLSFPAFVVLIALRYLNWHS
jgi:hypothetical protein